MKLNYHLVIVLLLFSSANHLQWFSCQKEGASQQRTQVLQHSSIQCTDFSATGIRTQMPSGTSLGCLGCGKRPSTARTGGEGGRAAVRSEGRADVSQVQVPTGLERSVFSISSSHTKVICGSQTPGLFLHSPSLLSFLPNINRIIECKVGRDHNDHPVQPFLTKSRSRQDAAAS